VLNISQASEEVNASGSGAIAEVQLHIPSLSISAPLRCRHAAAREGGRSRRER
jgi:hypothetical protein